MKARDFEKFADEMLQIAFQGGYADGADIQDLAEKCGLLEEVTRTSACSETGCVCAELGDFPQQCYSKTYK